MIPVTYLDDNREDRGFIDDCWSWLKDQPKDAWLLWARHANWDQADPIFAAMIDDPACDLALVSWLFWRAEPGFLVRNPALYRPDDLISRIVSNVSRGFYRSSELFYDRYEVVFAVHDYLAALLEQPGGPPPFRLPRILCGPFDGRRAALPARYDDETERGLAELFQLMDGWLPRSEEQHWASEKKGGNLWIMDRLPLPAVPADPVTVFASLDDAAYLEAIFGTREDYRIARTPPKKGWWPFG